MTLRLVPDPPGVDVPALAPSVRADRLADYLWNLGVSLARVEAEAYPTAAQVEAEVYRARRPSTTGGTR